MYRYYEYICSVKVPIPIETGFPYQKSFGVIQQIKTCIFESLNNFDLSRKMKIGQIKKCFCEEIERSASELL